MKLRNVAIAALSVLTLFGGGAAVYGASQVMEAQQQFVYSGYLLDGSENRENGYAKYTFEAGTTYKSVYPDSVIFKDTAGVQVATSNNAFLHFSDGSLSALTDGVIVDLNNMSNGVLNNYGVNAGTVLERRDSSYVVDSMSGTLYLDDFLWKINESQYMLVSSTIDIVTGMQEPIYYNDYVEMQYYNEGILMLITENGAYRTVASDCIATVNSGIALDLSSRTVTTDEAGTKMSMEQIVLDSNEAIDVLKPIMSAQKSDDTFTERQMNEAIKIALPTFEVIDGEDGVAGEAGTDGIAGEDGQKGMAGDPGLNGADGLIGADGLSGKTGENGKSGLDGAIGTDGTAGAPGAPGDPGEAGTNGAGGQNGKNGQNGQSGQSGMAGAAGAKGQDGVDGNEAIINGGLIEDNEDLILPTFHFDNFKVESHAVSAKLVIEDKGGVLTDTVKVDLLRAADGKVVNSYLPIEPGAGGAEIAFTDLAPDMEYRIRVTATYAVKDESGTDVLYENVFLVKSFTTDAIGISVNLVAATQNSLTFQVVKPDYLNVVQYFLSICNEDGTAVPNQSPVAIRDDEITFSGLNSNTAYLVSVTDIKLQGVEGEVPAFGERKYYTLKEKPTLGTPLVIVNKVDGLFDMRLSSVSDPDQGIEYYRYEVYDCSAEANSQTPVMTYYISDDRNVICEVDGTTIRRNLNYRVLVVAVFHDNEKTVEYASTYSEVFTMDGTPYPRVSFIKEDVNQHDSLKGKIRIDMNGGRLKINELGTNPIRIIYRSSVGKSYEYRITDLQAAQVSYENEVYEIPFEKTGLHANDTYTIEVWGTFSLLEDGEYWRYDTLLGTILENTKKAGTIQLDLQPDSNSNSNIAFSVFMSKVTNAATTEEQELDAYAYKTASVMNLEIIDDATESVVYSHEFRAAYDPGVEDGGLSEKLDTEEGVLFTEETMPGINTDLLRGDSYSVRITSVCDYTEYDNELQIESVKADHTWTFTKSEKLPDVNQVLRNPITVVEITNSMAASEYNRGINGLDGNAIVGYELRPNYSRITRKEKEFIFYVYEAAAITKNGSIPNETAEQFFADNNVPEDGKLLYTTTVEVTDTTVPKLTVWFNNGNNETETNEAANMNRGQQYVFAFEVKLNDGENNYFPSRGEHKAAITDVYGAPYVSPVMQFAHAKTDGQVLEYDYKIIAPDAGAVDDNLTVVITGGNNVSTNDTTTLVKSGEIGTVRFSNVNGGEGIVASLTERKYKLPYTDDIVNHIVINHCVEQVYSAETEKDNLEFSVENNESIGRLEFTVRENHANDDDPYLNRIVALKVNASAGGYSKEVVIPLRAIVYNNVEKKNEGKGYVYYSELSNLVGNGNITVNLTAIYDTGEAGFSVLKDISGNTVPVAIQTIRNAAKTSGGNYVIPNAFLTGYMVSVDNSAKNSWYKVADTMTEPNPFTNPTFASQHMLDSNFNSSLNLNATVGGVRLTSLEQQNYITMKKVGEALLGEIEVDAISNMLPTITVNANETSYTIYPSADKAEVHFVLNGHTNSNVLDGGTGTMFIDLFTVDSNNQKSKVIVGAAANGSWANCEVSENQTNYVVTLSGLETNQRYAIQFWYEGRDNSGGATGNKKYPMDTYQPEVEGGNAFFYFTTKDAIQIKSSYVTYSARGYRTEKQILVGLNLNDNVGFDIVYELVQGTLLKENGALSIQNEVQLLSSAELNSKNIISTTKDNDIRSYTYEAKLKAIPGTWKDENGQDISIFDRSDLFLKATPVSTQNHETALGNTCIIPLEIPQPTIPYYNVKTIPGTECFTIQIPRVADPGRTIVDDKYMIRIFEGSTDVTPESMVKAAYTSTQTQTILVNELKSGAKPQKDVVYRVEMYAVLDSNNDGAETVINEGTVGASTCVTKVQARTLGDQPYSFGELKLVNITSETLALFFIDSVGLVGQPGEQVVTSMEYTVVSPDGNCRTYINNSFALEDKGDGQLAIALNHTFNQTGTYTVNFRFLKNGISVGNDTALTYIKTNWSGN